MEAACWQASWVDPGLILQGVCGTPSPLFWSSALSQGTLTWASPPSYQGQGTRVGATSSILPIFDLLGSLERGTE